MAKQRAAKKPSKKKSAKATKTKPKAKAKPAKAKAKPAKATSAKAKPKAAKSADGALLSLYEGLQTNVFETVFAKNTALIKSFLAWGETNHARWFEEVNDDGAPSSRAIRLEMLITDEVDEGTFVAFFETLPAAQKKAAIAAMKAANEPKVEEEDDDEEDDRVFVRLSGKGLTTVPETLDRAVTHLNLSNNKLTTLPAWLASLEHLQEIDLGENPIKSLPAEFANAPALESLLLFKCYEVVVPAIPQLRLVMAQGTSEKTIASLAASPAIESITAMQCGLTEVPEALRALSKLYRLDLSDNQLETLPRWLADLPITSIYVGGNPLAEGEEEFAKSLSARSGD